MDLQLAGKVAIVTGGSRGLGLATARALVAEGCHVAICARGAERLEHAAAELRTAARPKTDVLTVIADVSRAGDVSRVVETTVKLFGGLDVLVNNVGLGRGGSIEETSDDTRFDAGALRREHVRRRVACRLRWQR